MLKMMAQFKAIKFHIIFCLYFVLKIQPSLEKSLPLFLVALFLVWTCLFEVLSFFEGSYSNQITVAVL